MEYQRSANREINELTKWASDAEPGFYGRLAMFLGKAIVFALLDIAQAIREGQRVL